MTSISIASVVNGSFVRRFQGLLSGSGSNPLQTSSSTTSISSALRLGAQTYGTAVQGLNSLISFTNISQDTLEQLGKLTDRMIDVSQRATKYISRDARNKLDQEFHKIADDFEKIIEKSKIGDKNYVTKDGLQRLFMVMGLDEESSNSVAEVFNKLMISGKDGDTALASEYEKGRRPVPVPPNAYYKNGGAPTSGVAGTFASTATIAGVVFTPGYDPVSNLRTGDINGDGKTDIYESNYATLYDSIHLGNGDGTFKAPIVVSSTQWNSSIQGSIGVSYDDDNAPDVIAWDTLNYDFAFLKGNGDGTFKAPLTIITGATTFKFTGVSGDFDKDGRNDFALSDTAGGFYLGLSNGDGTFAQTSIPNDYGNTDNEAIVSGDFNGDGNLDLVVGDQLLDASGFFYAGNGDGTFKAAVSLNPGADPLSQHDAITAGDFNGDSRLDLVYQDTVTGQVRLSLGNGNGSFQNFVTLPDTGVVAFSTGDLDSDGDLDIVTSQNNAAILTSNIWLNNGNGTFKLGVSYFAGTMGVNSQNIRQTPVVADFNGDGVADFLAHDPDLGTIEVKTGYASATAGGSVRSLTEYDTLFEDGRNIRTAPNAYQMLHDLKALRTQIDRNIEAMTKLQDFLKDNIDLVRAVGFAFLDESKTVSSASDAEAVAKSLQKAIINNAGAALSQAENLEAITVAALTLDKNSFISSE